MKTLTSHHKPTQEQITAARAFLIAKAYLETIEPKLKGLQSEVLEKFRYKWDLEKVTGPNGNRRDIEEWVNQRGEYCKNAFDLYLVNDQDFGHYMTEYNAKFIAAGFKVKEFGYCPLLVAENNLREAKRLLIDSMEPVTGITQNKLLCTKNWKENEANYIDITMRYLVQFIN